MLNIEPLLLRIERSQLRWFGHVSRMPRGKASQTSFTCKSKREKGQWDDHETLERLHWGSWVEPVGTSTKWNVGGGGGPWFVATQSWAAASAILTDI